MRSTHKLGQLSAGQVLAADGLISPEQLMEMVSEQQQNGERLTDIALARGLVTEFDIAKAMVRHLQLPFVRPSQYETPKEVTDLFEGTFVRHHRVIPIDVFGHTLCVATCGDLSAGSIESIEKKAQKKLGLFIAELSEMTKVFDERYPGEDVGQEVASRLDQIFGS